MKRLVFALLMVASALGAQRPGAKKLDTVWALPPDAWAITFCEGHGKSLKVRAAIDIAVFDSAMLAEEIIVHEQQHILQTRVDTTLCEPTWRQLLVMEVNAYCVSASIPIRHGRKPSVVYEEDLTYLTEQFDESDGEVTDEDVTRAWFAQCGFLLGLGGP